MTTVVRARFVLGYQGDDHVLLRDAVVTYSGDTIVGVGTRWDGPADEVIDVGDAIVIPGFIDLDALADVDHALLDTWSRAELRDGYDWSEDYWRHRRRDVFSPAERLEIREYALVQLLLHGVTTCMPIASEVHSSWAETYDELVGMAEIAERLGIRAYLGPSYRAGVNVVRSDGTRDVLWDHAVGDRGLQDARRFLRYADDLSSDLIKGALLPCRIETLTPDLMRATAHAALESGAPVRLHCLQGELELELLRKWHDRSPVELLDEAGLLETHLLIPHGIFLTDVDRARLVTAGASLVHCPLTSVRYGAVLRSFDRYRESGLNIALGTDSFPPDLIRGMDYGTNLAKIADERLEAGAHSDYVRAATLGGARALRRDDLGRIAPGARADLTVVALDDPRMGVIDDPLRTMLMNGSGRDVRMTVVAGRTVMRDGILPGVNLRALAQRAQELFDRMRSAYPERDVRRRSAAELFRRPFHLPKSD